jgi:diacylglycerol kinase
MITIAKGLFFNRFSLRSHVVLACLAVVVASYVTPSAAATPEERVACTPDVLRLCSSDIPNVERIVACMKRERSKLSKDCAAVVRTGRSIRSTDDPFVQAVRDALDSLKPPRE